MKKRELRKQLNQAEQDVERVSAEIIRITHDHTAYKCGLTYYFNGRALDQNPYDKYEHATQAAAWERGYADGDTLAHRGVSLLLDRLPRV